MGQHLLGQGLFGATVLEVPLGRMGLGANRNALTTRPSGLTRPSARAPLSSFTTPAQRRRRLVRLKPAQSQSMPASLLIQRSHGAITAQDLSRALASDPDFLAVPHGRYALLYERRVTLAASDGVVVVEGFPSATTSLATLEDLARRLGGEVVAVSGTTAEAKVLAAAASAAVVEQPARVSQQAQPHGSAPMRPAPTSEGGPLVAVNPVLAVLASLPAVLVTTILLLLFQARYDAPGSGVTLLGAVSPTISLAGAAVTFSALVRIGASFLFGQSNARGVTIVAVVVAFSIAVPGLLYDHSRLGSLYWSLTESGLTQVFLGAALLTPALVWVSVGRVRPLGLALAAAVAVVLVVAIALNPGPDTDVESELGTAERIAEMESQQRAERAELLRTTTVAVPSEVVQASWELASTTRMDFMRESGPDPGGAATMLVMKPRTGLASYLVIKVYNTTPLCGTSPQWTCQVVDGMEVSAVDGGGTVAVTRRLDSAVVVTSASPDRLEDMLFVLAGFESATAQEFEEFAHPDAAR